MEQIRSSDDKDHDLVKEEDEVHQLHVLLVDVVVPDRSNSDEVVAQPQEEVENEEEVEALVLKADAVVHPRRVVVDLEDTPIAYGAVTGANGLNVIALTACGDPSGCIQSANSLVAILQETLDVFGDTLEPIIFHKLNLLPALANTRAIRRLDTLLSLSLLNIFP